jgi:hypothetical protein
MENAPLSTPTLTERLEDGGQRDPYSESRLSSRVCARDLEEIIVRRDNSNQCLVSPLAPLPLHT